MRVEDEGVVAVISFYLYGLIALSLLVVISPLIVVAVPLLVVLGPLGIAWWRGRRASPRVGMTLRWWLVITSLLVLAVPVVPALWYLVAADDGPPPESIWLIVTGLVICPLALASTTYAIRVGRASEPDSPMHD